MRSSSHTPGHVPSVRHSAVGGAAAQPHPAARARRADTVVWHARARCSAGRPGGAGTAQDVCATRRHPDVARARPRTRTVRLPNTIERLTCSHTWVCVCMRVRVGHRALTRPRGVAVAAAASHTGYTPRLSVVCRAAHAMLTTTECVGWVRIGAKEKHTASGRLHVFGYCRAGPGEQVPELHLGGSDRQPAGLGALPPDHAGGDSAQLYPHRHPNRPLRRTSPTE